MNETVNSSKYLQLTEESREQTHYHQSTAHTNTYTHTIL